MAGFFDVVRLLLPGVFAEVHHWRERALNAEARLSELIGQIDATIERERERERLLGRLQSGEYSLPPHPEGDGWSGGMRPPAPHANPIARAYAKAKAEAEKATDAVVEGIVDEYLKMNAANNSDYHDARQ